MLLSLVAFVLFCALYYGLWAGWCRYAPDVLSPNAQAWIRRPNFFLFFFVTLIFLLIYRSSSR